MKQELDIGRHVVAELDQDLAETGEHLVLVAPIGVALVALQPREHRGGDVELDGELIVRDGGGELVDLAAQRGVEDRIDRLVQVFLQEQPDHRMGRNQIDLEAALGGDFPLLFELREVPVGSDGDIGIEQIAELDVLDRGARPQPVARARGPGGVHAKHLVRFLEGRIVGEHRLEPRDPVAALPGLSVGDTQQPRPERRADGFEHLTRVGERNAADEVDVARRHRSGPSRLPANPAPAQSIARKAVFSGVRPSHRSQVTMAST